MPTFTPCLWFFADDAEAAMTRYVELFAAYGPASIVSVSRAGEGVPGLEPGQVLTITADLGGREVMALNGGPAGFAHSEAMSLVVPCGSQEQVDHFWDGLTTGGGRESQCGWLVDPWGISWQIVPTRMYEMLESPDRDAAQRATAAMLTMSKLDLDALEAAFAAG